jgi:hypothetical protein
MAPKFVGKPQRLTPIVPPIVPTEMSGKGKEQDLTPPPP